MRVDGPDVASGRERKAAAVPGLRVGIAVLLIALGGMVWMTIARPLRHTPDAIDPRAQPLPELRVEINRASVAEITLLPGLGDLLAQRIVADRERNGPFESLESLQRVPGIGPRTVERIGPLISFGE